MSDRFRVRVGVAVAGVWSLLVPVTQPFHAALEGQNDPKFPLEDARQGLDLLMEGDPDAAIAAFRKIQERDAESPAGYLLEADAFWWKIYLATADLIDPEVLDVASSGRTPYDSRFEELVNLTLGKSAACLRANQDAAGCYLHQSLAYGLKARLDGLRGKDLATARAAVRMRNFSLSALRSDPNLTDALLGAGIYNYFEDTLPTVVKILRFLIALPGGDRERGLEQLQQVARKGVLARDDARFLLAKNYSRGTEKQYAKSLELFEQLARDYPQNPLWPLLAGSLQGRLGHAETCEAAYRQVFKRTAGEKSETRQAVHRAARKALEHLHPQEKFE